MPRSLVLLAVVLVLLIGGLIFLSMRDTHKEPVRVEKGVTLENLAN
ncbi:hypothetical protein ACFQ1E_16095 [Sphingomonas canadensis]|uniref:Uncharacterized protein n=1 Tax=Sphingomonas canadensis TaxID=1219257 RepID=A0ABW3HBQ6_9SPHN|nr:hypothetical protein [Sphingomonas canadensis]MCW3837567.1 hypothetical protein [Sphingomonas canadensis]